MGNRPSDQNNDNTRNINEVPFAEILFAFLLIWVAVELWVRFIENFAYGTLCLNKRSAMHSFLVAIVITIAFTAYFLISDVHWRSLA